MRLIDFLCLFVILSSCTNFSESEKYILGESRKVILSNYYLRDQQVNKGLTRVDFIISTEGNKERYIYDTLVGTFNRVDSIRNFYVENGSLLPNDFLTKSYYQDVEFPRLDHPQNFFPIKDSIIAYSWSGLTKYKLMKLYSNYVGFSCGGFTIDCIMVEPFCDRVSQGQEYKATFYLGTKGLTSLSKFEGENLIAFSDAQIGAEVKFLPDQSQKTGVWKGYHINGYDTIIIEIPYEIVDCP